MDTMPRPPAYRRMRTHSAVVLGASLILAVLTLYRSELIPFQGMLTLQHLHAIQNDLVNLHERFPWQTRTVFFLVYVTCAALSLPGTVLLSMASGATFGLGWGLLLASFASSVGATLAFWIARVLLRETAQQRLGMRMERINQGLATDGHWYLFSMRLMPVLPCFVINLAMGLTGMRTRTFYWVTQFGMLGATAVYVNAGHELQRMHDLSDAFSPTLVVSFMVLALLPLCAAHLRHRRSRAPA